MGGEMTERPASPRALAGLALAGAWMVLAAPAVAGSVEVEIRIAGERLVAPASPVIRAGQGDRVELRVLADTPVELHLHGYDLVTRAAPGAPGALRLEARASGRFPIALHQAAGRGHRHRPLLWLEVHPE
jgi:FtsP/CotA-like multicopper oxidase with cupredoxin domain